MYSNHFGLTQDPFSIAPDPRYLFMSERHREALAHLLYGVTGPQPGAGGSGGGFVLLTGDIGTGKTTICRCFLEQIPSGCHVAYIFNPKLTVTELLQSICEEFHIAPATNAASTPTVKDYIDALNSFLLRKSRDRYTSHKNGHPKRCGKIAARFRADDRTTLFNTHSNTRSFLFKTGCLPGFGARASVLLTHFNCAS